MIWGSSLVVAVIIVLGIFSRFLQRNAAKEDREKAQAAGRVALLETRLEKLAENMAETEEKGQEQDS